MAQSSVSPWLQTARTTGEILARGLELVNSVSYAVSLRWVFYGLLQEGYYTDKKGYTAWKALCARARHNFRDGWTPWTLADDTREIIVRTGGDRGIDECVEELKGDIMNSVDFAVDHFYYQDSYVQIWFEARAMTGQFKHYTEGVDLVPFGGDPSIALKWNIALSLDAAAQRYEKPITVLYFGDADEKGGKIWASALGHTRSWCNVDFEFVWCGLTMEQVTKYGVPENPAKPGEYQWEALSDAAAAEIIQTCAAQYVDYELKQKVEEEAQQSEEEWRERVEELIDDL